MAHGVRESDWKVFRELRKVALQRLCKRILAEVTDLVEDSSRSHHQRYLDLWDLLRDRDKDVQVAFDDPRRSRMIPQLIAIHRLGLLESSEFARFHPETRATIKSVVRSNQLH